MIYDEAGNHLGSTIVTDYNKNALVIEVEEIPPVLGNGERCRLLILSSPSPCEYQGRVTKMGARKTIAMFFGQEKESRGAVRYMLSCPALIENLVYENHAYQLHTPLEIKLINISQSGVRFRAPVYALLDCDRFQMRLKISDNDKLLIADVKNHFDDDFGASEYGCYFLIGSESVV